MTIGARVHAALSAWPVVNVDLFVVDAPGLALVVMLVYVSIYRCKETRLEEQ